MLDAGAEYAARYLDNVSRDRLFSRELMLAHGVPEALFEPTEELWDYIGATAEPFDADVRLHAGDAIRAGGRELRAVARPGHSATDTLLVDASARLGFVGDHLLARISANTEIYGTVGRERSRSRVDYLAGLRKTARMPLRRFLPGHGPVVHSARERIRGELAQHRRRCARILRILAEKPSTAFEIGRQMWRERLVREQPLLVVWEVLGHLELLLAAGAVTEDTSDGCSRFAPTRGDRRARIARRAQPALVHQG
jgi:glyoxylase-like metal-dependent hydrolase (beta-lactamase superfamily II)